MYRELKTLQAIGKDERDGDRTLYRYQDHGKGLCKRSDAQGTGPEFPLEKLLVKCQSHSKICLPSGASITCRVLCAPCWRRRLHHPWPMCAFPWLGPTCITSTRSPHSYCFILLYGYFQVSKVICTHDETCTWHQGMKSQP